MPSTIFNARTYSRKPSKRKADDSKLDVKRRKVDADDDQVSTDVEDEPQPPQRLPRDLSQIFESVTPSAPASPSPGKLAKRMLSRSRTESSMASGSGSSSNSIARAPSLPNPQDTRTLPTSPAATPEAKQSPIPRTKSSGKTYAGASRSFLVPIPVHPASLEQLQDDLDDEFASRESYTSLRTRWGVDESEDDPYAYGSPTKSGSNASTPNPSPSKKGKGKARPEPALHNGMMNPLKSITELRNRGESRRFLDEVGYLWEGLDASVGLGLRRSSALEINTKLCDSEFARKAKTADFIGQTWDYLLDANREDDKIMNILLAFFCAIVSQDSTSLSELAQRASVRFTQTLFSMLASFPSASDPLAFVSDAIQLRKLGMSKKDQSMLSSIHSIITSSSLFPRSTPLSTALLVSHTLAALPSTLLEATSTNINALLANFKEHLSPLTPSLSTLITTSQHSDKRIAFMHIHNFLSLFDSYLLGGWSPQSDDISVNQQQLESARDSWLADGLISFAIFAEVTSLRSTTSTEEQDKARQCMLAALRLLVGLTHSDKVWCGKLTNREDCFLFILRTILRGHADRLEKVKEEEDGTVKREEPDVDQRSRKGWQIKREDVEDEDEAEEIRVPRQDSKDKALDALCLGLGLLTNLIQVDDGVKNTLREIYASTQCTPTKCLKQCKCPRRLTALKALLRIYMQLLEVPTTKTTPVKRECSPDGPADLLAAGETRLLLSHLSLLFGLLMKDNEANQTDIINSLPDPPSSLPYDGDCGKVQMLIVHAKEFAYLYTEGEAADEEGENVRSVIGFLEGLRDKL
ncbi:hypothetical protein C8F01DRAFT_1125033 [Mycena amicta]|nr:hypothetical protein C8F01DRAFT_1125033 [Mycena amicta]